MRAIYALNALDWMWTINYIEWKSSSSFWHGSWRGMSFIHNVRCSQSSLNVIFRLQVCSFSPSLSLLLTHFFGFSDHSSVCMGLCVCVCVMNFGFDFDFGRHSGILSISVYILSVQFVGMYSIYSIWLHMCVHVCVCVWFFLSLSLSVSFFRVCLCCCLLESCLDALIQDIGCLFGACAS